MKITRSLLFSSIGAGVAALLAVGCSDASNGLATSPTALGSSASLNVKAGKVDICHVGEEGLFKLISINLNALGAHEGHGDRHPGDPVPGDEGKTFDDACVPTGPVTIEYSLNDFWKSTTKISNGGGLPSLTLPADGTFSLPPIGATTPGYQGTFWRYTFTLPSGYSNLTFSLSARANDVMAVFLNGTVVATQDDTANIGLNHYLQTYEFAMDAAGVVTASYIPYSIFSVWDDWDSLTLTPANFQAGGNSLIIYGGDTCCDGSSSGQILSVANGVITFNQ